MADDEVEKMERPQREARKCSMVANILLKEERKAVLKEVTCILKKAECDRSGEELIQLQLAKDVVKLVEKRAKLQKTRKDRLLEVEDDTDVLDIKCKQLAEKIKTCKNIVVYTGAGISTAASIPDYRGPNGIWTLLKKGQEPRAQDLSDAEPTLTHMSIAKLQQEKYISYVVSQNCDGLHLRSGLHRNCLSEVHGNMYIELCYNCKPRIREYVRLFDVTEKTGIRRHATGRTCHRCGGMLKDTIVHFGEKGGMKSPYQWKQAFKSAKNADMVLCLGTSLKVLRKYPCLWAMDKRPSQRPNLYIVNLQWTPKDDIATLKINGRCDDVMERVMKYLNIDVPGYSRHSDPIFKLATPLFKPEQETIEKKILKIPQNKPVSKSVKNSCDLKPNDYSSLRTLLETPSRHSIPLLPVNKKIKQEPKQEWKRTDISPEVRDKLNQMLRRNQNMPTVFHNPMMVQLPIFSSLLPYYPADDSHLNIPHPSTSKANINLPMHNTQFTGCIDLQQREYLRSPVKLFNMSTSLQDLKNKSHINSGRTNIDIMLDHNYYKEIKLESKVTDSITTITSKRRKFNDNTSSCEDSSSLDGSETDSVSSILFDTVDVQPKSVVKRSAPGWFGKGLNIKRKRKA